MHRKNMGVYCYIEQQKEIGPSVNNTTIILAFNAFTEKFRFAL